MQGFYFLEFTVVKTLKTLVISPIFLQVKYKITEEIALSISFQKNKIRLEQFNVYI